MTDIIESPTVTQPRSTTGAMGVAVAGAGAAALATAASACCVPIIAPLIVAVLGASGAAWAAGLKPFSLPILFFAGLFLAYGYWALYRPRSAGAGEACPVRPPRVARTVLWIATTLWAAALLLNLASLAGAFQP